MTAYASNLSYRLRRLWAYDRFAQSMQVFIAMAGILIFCVSRQQVSELVAPFLGVIAAALAESDDDWRDRLLSFVTALLSFLIVCVGVELLFDRPIMLALSLAPATFFLIMLGAMGQRFALVGMATLVLAIYTMISLEQHHGDTGGFWHEPLGLVGGAFWYCLVSLFWYAFFSHQPVKLRAVQALELVGDYIVLKASLFEPVSDRDTDAIQSRLVVLNRRIAVAFKSLDSALMMHLDSSRNLARMQEYNRLFLIMQELYGRANSTHYPYAELQRVFFHHDVLFRAQRLLERQGKACKALGQALVYGAPFDYHHSQPALGEFLESIEALDKDRLGEEVRLIRSLYAIARNLGKMEEQLVLAGTMEPPGEGEWNPASGRTPVRLRTLWSSVRAQLTLQSPLFRHACRLSVIMVIGYALLQWVHPGQGYWIILTAVFVCRPGYGATLAILRQRISGTVIGLILGGGCLHLFNLPVEQAILALVAAVSFFVFRLSRYTIATASITVMVLCCFNLIDNGYTFILPRLVDTLIGAALTVLAVLFIFPDWHHIQLLPRARSTLGSVARCMEALLHQLVHREQRGVDYRGAFRAAQNETADLSNLLDSLLHTPKRNHFNSVPVRHFIIHMDSLLACLSTLSAHRDSISLSSHDPLLQQAEQSLTKLKKLAEGNTAGISKPDETAAVAAGDTLGEDPNLGQLAEQEVDSVNGVNPREMTRMQLDMISHLIGSLRQSLDDMENGALQGEAH